MILLALLWLLPDTPIPSTIPLTYLLPDRTLMILDAASTSPETVNLFQKLYPSSNTIIRLEIHWPSKRKPSRVDTLLPVRYILVTGPIWDKEQWRFPPTYIHLQFHQPASQETIQELVNRACLMVNLTKKY